MSLDVLIKKVNKCGEIPKYTREGDGALDLKSCDDYIIAPGERKLIDIGISIAIPDGYCALVLPRSGNAIKHGITLPNAPGLIDSNYRGEIKVPLINHDKSKEFRVNKGDRIAQLLIIEYPKINFIEVEELDNTSRGENGFGSSGY